MSCFPCFKSQRSKKSLSRKEAADSSTKSPENKKVSVAEAKDGEQGENKFINAKAYNFRELATATKNFRQECLLGEGGFGKVFKGTFQSNGQVVAVKQLDRHGLNESKEFLADISSLSLLNHPNLVNLVGYCADGDQRILVYEYMTGGSLESHLFIEQGKNKKPLDWFTRIKIASGAARGMEHLHEQANPPVIYSYLKASNILLDEEFNPKLSDIGLTKLSPSSDKMQGPSRMMGTYGYCAPEYTRSGEVSLKSDVYSFGVVLLEIITGRRAVDTTRPSDEQNLVTWAQPYFRDPKKFPDLADPLLQGKFIEKDLNQVVGIAAMCLQEESMVRPLISDVVTTLSFLTTIPPEGFYPPPAEVAAPSENKEDKDDDQDDASSKCSKDEDTYSNDASDVDIDEDVFDDGDVSDSQDEKSEDEYEAATTKEAKVLNSKSSRKSNSSDDEGSVCSSRSSSSRSLDGSESSTSLGSSRRSGSNLRELSQKSSKGSRRLLGALGNKKSKKSTKRSDLKGQESRKSSIESYESFSQSSSLVSRDRGSTADLSASLSCKRLQDGDATLQAKQQQEMKE